MPSILEIVDVVQKILGYNFAALDLTNMVYLVLITEDSQPQIAFNFKRVHHTLLGAHGFRDLNSFRITHSSFWHYIDNIIL